jgi:hypothetical protein
VRRIIHILFGAEYQPAQYLLTPAVLARPLILGLLLYVGLLWRTPNENHHDVFAWMINTLIQALVIWGVGRSYLAHHTMVGPSFDEKAANLDKRYLAMEGWRRTGFVRFAHDTRRRLREMERFKAKVEHHPFLHLQGSAPSQETPSDELDFLDDGTGPGKGGA